MKILDRTVCTLDVSTPLGVVHLAGFSKKKDHRTVIFSLLSKEMNANITAENLVEINSRPTFFNLDFDANWTHSADYCVLAYNDKGSHFKIGVDLEKHSPRRLPLAFRFFSEEEILHLKNLEQDFAEIEFFRLWCRKEAFYKCKGGEFFKDALKSSMLYRNDVFFIDLKGKDIAAPVASSLCIAVYAE